MVLNDSAQTFLFTFRSNGVVHGVPSYEILVEQLADYDPSSAADAYRRTWFGNEDELRETLNDLAFAESDVEGVLSALRTHRDADRRLAVTPDQLQDAGFREVA